MQIGVAIFLLLASAIVSIWVLQLGWLLAAVGLLLALIAIAPKARFLFLPGVALFVAPWLNIFLLMPVLRQVFH